MFHLPVNSDNTKPFLWLTSCCPFDMLFGINVVHYYPLVTLNHLMCVCMCLCLLGMDALTGTDMTPNYVDSSFSNWTISPWCTCKGSGNQEEECMNFLRYFTDNTCLSEPSWHTNILHVSEMCFVAHDAVAPLAAMKEWHKPWMSN